MDKPFTWVTVASAAIVTVTAVYVFYSVITKPPPKAFPDIPAPAVTVVATVIPSLSAPLVNPAAVDSPIVIPQLPPGLKWSKKAIDSNSLLNVIYIDGAAAKINGSLWTSEVSGVSETEMTSVNRDFISHFNTYHPSSSSSISFDLNGKNHLIAAMGLGSPGSFGGGYIQKYLDSVVAVNFFYTTAGDKTASLKSPPVFQCPCVIGYQVFISDPVAISKLIPDSVTPAVTPKIKP